MFAVNFNSFIFLITRMLCNTRRIKMMHIIVKEKKIVIVLVRLYDFFPLGLPFSPSGTAESIRSAKKIK